MSRKFYIIFAVAIILISCVNKSKQDFEKDYLSSVIKDISLPKNTKWVVVLPGMGCHGCIQEGEYFMQQHVNDKKVFFILTSIESLKTLQNKTGIKLKDHDNILIDNGNKVHIPGDNSIYPCIILVSNNTLIGYQFQSPANGNAFDKLKLE